jgi:hypothetical protein
MTLLVELLLILLIGSWAAGMIYLFGCYVGKFPPWNRHWATLFALVPLIALAWLSDMIALALIAAVWTIILYSHSSLTAWRNGFR